MEGSKEDKEGCFVYQFTFPSASVSARCKVSVEGRHKTDFALKNGELVAVDLIRPGRSPPGSRKNGPFLRLADGSGWLFEYQHGDKLMTRVPVSTGLWRFYVDNTPAGICLRRHPVDRVDVKEDYVSYQPMQKLHCDRKVTHPKTGVNFYRVQGTNGWIFDRRPATREGEDDAIMLLGEDMIQNELTVYEAVDQSSEIRLKADVGDNSRTGWDIRRGELIAADVIRQCPLNHGNGPFLRLTDGSGWLFENKLGMRCFQRLNVYKGNWRVRVLNEPTGIGLRRQPSASTRVLEPTITYKPGAILMCNRMVQASSGIKFYRVERTDGWIFDWRDDKQMLVVVSEAPWKGSDMDLPAAKVPASGAGWSPDFVRGVAATMEGVREVDLNRNNRVISFKVHPEGVHINVYYVTRTIGAAFSHPVQGETHLFRRNCTTDDLVSIFKKPRLFADQEDEARNGLMELDEELAKMMEKRLALMSKVRDIDTERAAESAEFHKKIKARLVEQDELTCKECGQLFPSIPAMQQHYNAFHMFKCEVCGKAFTNEHMLWQHREALGHFASNF